MDEELKTNKQKIQYVNLIFKGIWEEYRDNAAYMDEKRIKDMAEKSEKILTEEDVKKEAKVYASTNQGVGNLIRFDNNDVVSLEDILMSKDKKNLIIGINVKFDLNKVNPLDLTNYTPRRIENLLNEKYRLEPYDVISGLTQFNKSKDNKQKIPSPTIRIFYSVPINEIKEKLPSAEKYIRNLFIGKIGHTVGAIRDPYNKLNKHR